MSFAKSYRRMFDRFGRRVSIERTVANADPLIALNVRARLTEARPIEVAGGVTSTERRVLILAEDVPPTLCPLRKGDYVVVDGLRLRFTDRPDDQTRRDGETLIAFEGWAAGG
ncbi:hypothetical protein ACLNGM_10065 [Aureimonas phyllosphaerae]|uniref:hypothetical protein n=1 Tax=Aureimonas phyllosphaerae TaxID=1166078 RepID=UPI003A5BED91